MLIDLAWNIHKQGVSVYENTIRIRSASTLIAVRRFTDVALMIRSDVRVTVVALPPASRLSAPVSEPLRPVLTVCFAPLRTVPDRFGSFVIR